MQLNTVAFQAKCHTQIILTKPSSLHNFREISAFLEDCKN